MEATGVFVAIARLTGEIALHYWPVSVTLVLAAAAALTLGSPVRSASFRARARVMALTYLVPLIIILVGTAFRQSPPLQPSWYNYALWNGPIVVYLIGLLAFILFSKGARLRSIAFLAPGLWLSGCAFLPAGFAIAGMAP